MRQILSITLIISGLFCLKAQTPKKYTSSELFESIKKLNFLGSVLYVAAHPDDENTHLISYFSNEIGAQTAYISLTRGDGGQNLIGLELRELLGVIRTQELLQARRIDGGIQFFTRANDFGYSKNPEETFQFWNKEEVLSDLVYIIRKFQPDVIINRFDHRTPGSTHGHHTASAILSQEAFDLSAQKNQFPEQLNRVSVWQAKRLFFNPSWFFFGSREAFDKVDKSNYFKMDIGVFYSTLGVSNSEIAAKSRSQHSSQGFGATAVRGSAMEYLELLKGEKFEKDIFEGIDTSWNRVKGGKEIGELLAKVEREFNFKDPSQSVPDLVKAYKMIQNLDDEHWKKIKSEEIKNIIYHCSGLFLEAVAETPYTTVGGQVDVKIEAINRSNLSIKLNSVQFVAINKDLKQNEVYNFDKTLVGSIFLKPTSPYWLEEKGSLGMYKVSDAELIGLPETSPPYSVTFNLTIAGQKFDFQKSVVYKYNDPAKGETYKPFAIVPEISVSSDEKVLVFSENQSKIIEIKVKAFTDEIDGILELKVAKEWTIHPKIHKMSFSKKGEIQTVKFEIIPPKNQNETFLIPEFTVGNQKFNKEVVEIKYEHIPEQKVVQTAEIKLVRLDLQKKGNKIAYIEGAGDSLPENLKQIGYEVQTIQPQEITIENLEQFDAIVLGVRAFNTVPELRFKNQILFDFVKKGGNLIVQYNTNQALVTEVISPLSLKLSRNRVTDEFSTVKFLSPNHPVLNVPNKISSKDFEGWVQERGLYFPNEWDEAFVPILEMNDPGESGLQGSLLIAPYGKGNYIYTGLSFFRELPAGVSGAYRLFANILSLGK